MAKETKEGKGKRRDEIPAVLRPEVESFAPDAERFKALGDPTRLAVIGFLLSHAAALTDNSEIEVDKTLVDAPEEEESADGATVTEIAAALTGKSGKEPSTLSHHLKELRHAGLIAMTRHGKNLHYRVEMSAITTLCERLHCRDIDRGEDTVHTP